MILLLYTYYFTHNMFFFFKNNNQLRLFRVFILLLFFSHTRRSLLAVLLVSAVCSYTYAFFLKDRDCSRKIITHIKIVVEHLSCCAIASNRVTSGAWLPLELILTGRVARATPVCRERWKSTCRSFGPLSAKRLSLERIIARFNLGRANAARISEFALHTKRISEEQSCKRREWHSILVENLKDSLVFILRELRSFPWITSISFLHWK